MHTWNFIVPSVRHKFMKILHYSPQMSPGRTSALAADLACSMQSDDCHNIVVAPPSELISRLHTSGVQHFSCRKPNLLTFLREIRRLRKLIRRQAPDVVQVYSADAAWIVHMACKNPKRMKKMPKIVGAITGYAKIGSSALSWSRCHYFTVGSKHLRKVLQADNSPLKCNPWVIPHGIDERLCNPAYRPTDTWMKEWRAANPHYTERLSICVPCALSPLHGLENIAPILTGLLRSGIPAHVYIVGDLRKARTAYIEELKTLYANADLTGHITWSGACPDLRDVLRACDITLSLSEKPATYDRPILEALALGCPVVGFDHGIVGEYLSAFLPEGRVAPGDIAGVLDTLIQWSTYLPTPISEIPAPYRLTDTAATYLKLYQDITEH